MATSMSDVTVCIPSIPPRESMLKRALMSVAHQTYTCETAVAIDTERKGAPATRDVALNAAQTDWVAFLDDDDWLYPQHIERLLQCAADTNADLVYPWFDVVGGTDPFPQFFARPWDDNDPHQIPITFLCTRKLALAVGGFSFDWDTSQGNDPGLDEYGNRAGEDYRFTLRCVAAGAKIVHLPEKTWGWSHHGSNTSGLPSRW